MRKRIRFRNKETKIKIVGGEIAFNFEGKGIEAWANRLVEFGNAAEDMEPALSAFGNYMLGSIDRNFTAEGRPNRWASLKPTTIQDRFRQGYGAGPILQRSGKLRKSFRSNAGKDYLRITNNVRYFKYHQTGTKKMPQRIMIYLQDRDKAQFTRIVRQHLGIER